MECKDILQPSVVLEILRNPEKKYLQANISKCIYSEYHGNFIRWIMNEFGYLKSKEELNKDAKDTFQDALIVFLNKCSDNEFVFTASVKTYFYRIGQIIFLNDHWPANKPHSLKSIGLFFRNLFSEMFGENDIEKLPDDFTLNDLDKIDNKVTGSLKAILAIISQKRRHILVMKFILKLNNNQIADKLKTTANAVENEIIECYKIMCDEWQLTKDKKPGKPDAADAEEEDCYKRMLTLVLAALPQQKQEIVIMKFFKRLSSKEIAKKMGITPGTVDNIVCAAYKELRALLKSKCAF